jgi:hypothetical protein
MFTIKHPDALTAIEALAFEIEALRKKLDGRGMTKPERAMGRDRLGVLYAVKSRLEAALSPAHP